jgi:drug/metabolite transporter (DMT)-like permease
MMAWPTLICGALLVLVGIVGYGTAEPKPGQDSVSPTALIPAFFGVALVVCGALAFNDKLRKHVMHLAAVIGLVGAIGGFMPLIRQINNTGEFDPTKKSAIAGELMILVCLVFVGMCVNSFIQARKARKAKEASGTPGASVV